MRATLAACVLLLVTGWGFFPVCEAPCRALNEDEQLILVGTGAYKDGFVEIAERQFTQFVRDFPSHGKVYEVSYLLGKTLYGQGKLKEARAVFLRIANQSKGFEELDHVFFWLADIELKLGNPEEARKFLSTVVRRYPRFEWIDHSYSLLGLLEIGAGRPEAAESSFKRVSQGSKNQELVQGAFFWLGILSFKQKRYEAALDYFERVTGPGSALPQGYSKYALFWLGETQLRLGRLEDARGSFTRFTDRFRNEPIVAEALWRVGFCEYRLGNTRQAAAVLGSFKQQYKDSPLLPYTQFLLSQIFLTQGDATASAQEAALLAGVPATNGFSGVALVTLFWDSVQGGDGGGASRVAQKLQKLDRFEEEKIFVQWLSAELGFCEGKIPDALPYYFNIVNSAYRERALSQIGKGYFFEGKYREAVTNFDILALEFPSSRFLDESLFLKAESLTRLKQPDQALETYRLVLKQGKRDPWQLFTWVQIGTLRAAEGRNAEAEEAYRKVIEGFPNHPLCYHAALQLGNLFFKDRRLMDAIAYYSLVPKGNILELFGQAYFGLGESLYQDGKYERAFLSFENVLRHVGEGSLWFILAQLEMGNLQRRWGKVAEAKQFYRTVLDRSKDEEVRKVAKERLSDLESR